MSLALLYPIDSPPIKIEEEANLSDRISRDRTSQSRMIFIELGALKINFQDPSKHTQRISSFYARFDCLQRHIRVSIERNNYIPTSSFR